MEWATDARGRCPARDAFETLSAPDQARVLATFQRLADVGRIENREHFKNLGRLGGELWEFKRFQHRFLGDFRRGYRFLVAHYVQKKQDRHRPVDIETALRLLRENDENEG